MRIGTPIAVWTLSLAAGWAQSSVTETVLHSFGGLRGTNPQAGLTVGANGNFYGTTSMGGSADLGVVFMLTLSGQETLLHTFTGGADGALPYAGVVFDAEGNLYGTTTQGGTANLGVVYEMSAAGVETVLHSFLGGADGADPEAGVVLDAAGNLYGTTSEGGAANAGTVFKVDDNGEESVLYAFSGGADGLKPVAPVLLDSSGNLYGTTCFGGSGNGANGVVFKVDATGKETVLYSFTGGTDGGSPAAGLTRDAAGNLYGTTLYGGGFLGGVIFELGTAGKESVVYDFKGSGYETYPSGVMLDGKGNLYATLQQGNNVGSVLKLNMSTHVLTQYNFTGGAGGYWPTGGVIADKAGNLYGTTLYGESGQTYGGGIVFKLDTSFNETVLFSFSDATGGNLPSGGLVSDAAGDFFGTAYYGGADNQGLVFKVAANGTYSVLHSFTGGDGGGYPSSGLIRDDAGNLYGTTRGGSGNASAVYKLAPTGAYTELHRFIPVDFWANSGVVRDGAGNLYGTTQSNEENCPGNTVYKIAANGTFSTLYNFTGGADGCAPQGVILDSSGNLYGTESGGGAGEGGVIYRITPAGQFTVLYSFSESNGTYWPAPGLVRDEAGNLYGTTDYGGSSRYSGVLFKLSAAGQFSVLYELPSSQGVQVSSGPVRDALGNFYFTTMYGGVGDGAAYKVGPTGQLLGEFNLFPGAGGYLPSSGLIVDQSGNVYGETNSGGAGADGVVFKLTFAAPPQ